MPRPRPRPVLCGLGHVLVPGLPCPACAAVAAAELRRVLQAQRWS